MDAWPAPVRLVIGFGWNVWVQVTVAKSALIAFWANVSPECKYLAGVSFAVFLSCAQSANARPNVPDRLSTAPVAFPRVVGYTATASRTARVHDWMRRSRAGPMGIDGGYLRKRQCEAGEGVAAAARALAVATGAL